MKFFGIDPEKQATIDASGRLARPWTVFIFGVLLSVAFAVAAAVRSTHSRVLDDKVSIGMLAFAGLAVVLSGAYAYIGARYSKRLAQRTVGIAGSIVIAGGLAALVYALLVLAP